MAKKKGLFTLLTGAALGATAVLLADKKNRKKAEKTLNNPKQVVDDVVSRGKELIDSMVTEKTATKKVSKKKASKTSPKSKKATTDTKS